MMFDTFRNRVSFEGTLTAKTALRVSAGRSVEVSGTDLPVVRDTLGLPYIPGSSFKGVLRAYAESLIRSVRNDRKWACNPVGDKDQWCLSSSDGLDDEPQIEAQLCRVCKVFGSPWFASRVSIRDLTVDAAEWFEQFEIRNGVAIDRDTGTAAEGLLYDFEVVPAGTSFNCRIVVENAEDWQLGLLCAGLAPFERGEASLGGGRSRGLGQVELSWTRRTIIDATSQDSALECLLGMTDPPAVDDARLTSWRSAFIDELKSGGQDAQAAAQ